MNDISLLKNSEQTSVNTLPTYSSKKQLLIHTTLIAISVVFILTHVIAVSAFASLLPSFVVVLSGISIILGLVFLGLRLKHIFAHSWKTKTIDSSTRDEHHATVQKLLAEIQDLQNKALDYKNEAAEMKNEYDSLLQGCIEDRATYLGNEDAWRFENKELEACITELKDYIAALQQMNEDCDTRLQEEQHMHMANRIAYEAELCRLELRLKESNRMIERQRSYIKEIEREIKALINDTI
ncbi:hypothetical protein ABCH17_01615 [Chlamydia abortus]|uniref:hypothetical protein n=1 Tax=Chlamydia abortus TaxID=83555 RepID=UPI0032EAA883